VKRTAKGGAAKPVILGGVSFEDILKALLKTRPMPEENKRKSNGQTPEVL
jgi:hypothetical protein